MNSQPQGSDRCRIAEVAAGDGALIATWRDGAVAHIPFLWLRHNCACDECVVRQTAEKRVQLFAVPENLKPCRFGVAQGACGEGIAVEWPDGHSSWFDAGELKALLERPKPSLRYWDHRFRPSRFDFRGFLHDDEVAAACIEEFLAAGVCILGGAPTAPDTVERLAPRLGPVREVLFERIHNVKVNPAGYNIAHTCEAVPPHNDMVSYCWPPSVQALHMLVNHCAGGETGIVDGFAVLRGLRRERPDHFDALCAVPVPFRQFDADNETNASCPTIELDASGEVRMLRFSNQLMQRVLLCEPRLAEFYVAWRELARRINAPEAQARFRLEAGQVLLAAGHRVLHARAPIVSAGPRHLQDAYFEHDNIRNHLTLLKRQGRVGAAAAGHAAGG